MDLHKDINEDVYLGNIDNEQKKVEYKPRKKVDEVEHFDEDGNQIDEESDEITKYFFADTESLVDFNPHRGFMSAISEEEDDKIKIILRKDNDPASFIMPMLDYISKIFTKEEKTGKAVVYYHNLKYDYHLFKKYLCLQSVCKKDGNYYNVIAKYQGLTIEFRDSYKLIPKKLADFSKMFSLGDDISKKEAIGYTFYNEGNIYKDKALIRKYIKHVKEEHHDIFMDNVKLTDKKGNYLFDYDEEEETFNHMKYYQYYLKYDVLTLKAGFLKFRSLIAKITDLDAFEYLTISSLTHQYMLKNGGYEGVYEMKGNLRDFCSGSIYGGRTNANSEERLKVIIQLIVDFDAVSLYPSAIKRMCDEMGVPIGKAKLIENHKDKQILKFDYFITKVHITKINKKQQNPFIAHRVDGCINYINELPKGGIKVTIDKITLEDYIKFHEIEYEFIEGVYWDEGYNKKLGELINNLFNERLKVKKLMKETTDKDEKAGYDALQEVIKLMLNSAYGKTILKKSNEQTIIIKNKGETQLGKDEIIRGYSDYVYNYFHVIKEINIINDHFSEIKRVKMDDSYNMAHVGCLILSYSKRIMNEVMDLASDNDIDIYYQDTDSMHIKQKDIKKLEKLYKKEYGKELIGENMGQFHSDFKLKGAVKNIVSVKSIFLGKKSYIDKLEGEDKDGNKVEGYHMRMKGITEEGLEHRANESFDGDYFAMYEKLCDGEPMEFILNPGSKKLFEFGKNEVITRGEFKRTVTFKRGIIDIQDDDEPEED